MQARPSHLPEGYHTLTPYLIVDGAARAIAFYKAAFGAVEVLRLDGPGGTIGHAEIVIGDSRLMLADEHPEFDAQSPRRLGGSPVTLHLYVDDADAWIARAVAAGASPTRPVENQFYGDRIGGIRDPFGYVWWCATRKETLTPDELRRRSEEHLRRARGG
ncbi:MAG TPA: VOC family protein [Stellaceae bacterium]|nr:VOC family protein [Stellaceae bacterium]